MVLSPPARAICVVCGSSLPVLPRYRVRVLKTPSCLNEVKGLPTLAVSSSRRFFAALRMTGGGFFNNLHVTLICHTGSMQYNCRSLMKDGDCDGPAGKKTMSPSWFDHFAQIVSPGSNGAEGSIVSCPAATVATRTDIRLTAHQGHHPLATPERRQECFTSVSTGL